MNLSEVTRCSVHCPLTWGPRPGRGASRRKSCPSLRTTTASHTTLLGVQRRGTRSFFSALLLIDHGKPVCGYAAQFAE